MGFSRIQRAAPVEAYFTNKSYKKCVEIFQARFPDSVKPSKSMCMISSNVFVKLEELTTGKEADGPEQ
jgi:hypothetical protein